MTKFAVHAMLSVGLGLLLALPTAMAQKSLEITDFSLPDGEENEIKLSAYKEQQAVVVVFMSSHCSWATKYADRLGELFEQYKDQKVTILAINSNDASLNELDAGKVMRTVTVFPFPYLKDEQQEVAKQFKATKNPEAYVLIPKGGKFSVVYQGKIDDNPLDAKMVRHNYLTDAIDAVLAGKKPEVASSPASGCNIKWR